MSSNYELIDLIDSTDDEAPANLPVPPPPNPTSNQQAASNPEPEPPASAPPPNQSNQGNTAEAAPASGAQQATNGVVQIDEDTALHQANTSEFECSICFDLIYDPVVGELTV
jgi:hypothetical protein